MVERMRLNRNRRSDALQLATPGMIDIVFLLLIFFLVNSSFRPVERQVESQLTDSSSGAQTQEDPLVIRIRPADTGFQFQVGGRTFATRKDLISWLHLWPQRSTAVLLVGPAQAPIELSILTLNDCRVLGFENVSYVPEANESGSASEM